MPKLLQGKENPFVPIRVLRGLFILPRMAGNFTNNGICFSIFVPVFLALKTLKGKSLRAPSCNSWPLFFLPQIAGNFTNKGICFSPFAPVFFGLKEIKWKYKNPFVSI